MSKPSVVRAWSATRSLFVASVLLLGGGGQAWAAPFSQMILFGDSLSDPGNFYAATGDFAPPPPAYWNGRFSNGPVAAEYLASKLGFSSAQVSNYAVSGSYTGTDNAVLHDPLYINDPVLGPVLATADLPGMRTQMERYLAQHTVDSNALYVVWGGPNDFAALMRDPASTPQAYQAAVIEAVTNLATITQTLIMSGAQHVMVGNMPNLGRTPGAAQAGPQAVGAATGLSIGFNSVLDQALSGIDAMAPGRVVRFDAFSAVEGIVANASAFGLTETQAACLWTSCAMDPTMWNQHLFWDWQHPTTYAHELLADAMFDAVVPEPGSLALAGIALFAVMLGRRRSA
ncbi:SGNH/GDSL hydrolase family protein [Niveibacterium sp. 24ML]|uniref:SGNH/GDSL hydrolase family protein n=1 Tax=Niveibacterium sp. 24ML TaxID=2985512 RepID=UPI00226E09E3|nr:SGNH/GDSL hydrolase family protein [Niveibacterium sp. 24ML]MCX9157636.1 SGNH/GDSL hydrolase family protein [Niveibacterium sp. 24ML]